MNIKLKRAVTLSMMLAIAVVLNIVEYPFSFFYAPSAMNLIMISYRYIITL
jgi:hypothetical protein